MGKKAKHGTVVLNVSVKADTVGNGVKGMENFARLIAKLSEGETCVGITNLEISAEMIARPHHQSSGLDWDSELGFDATSKK